MMNVEHGIKLSICIATYKRASYIGETLDSILTQLNDEVEVILVDGNSPDNTTEVVKQYLNKSSQIFYFKEEVNSGVDGDYDKAVGYARGDYCWLMTDDDLLKPGAINKVVNVIKNSKNAKDLIVVNAELRNAKLTEILDSNRLSISQDFEYFKHDNEEFFKKTANYLSFIGSVVILKSKWCARRRSEYYGSYFVHVGVIFQNPPLENVLVFSEPLIIIRHGNSMWTPRSFEIWSFRWQELIWSFGHYSKYSKELICHKEPWRRFQTLLYARAMGAYSNVEFDKFLKGRLFGRERLIAYAAAKIPSKLANIVVVSYFSIFRRFLKLAIYDLLRTDSKNLISRNIASILGTKI